MDGKYKVRETGKVGITVLDLDLDLSNNWQTSHREYHANEEVMLLAVFKFQA